MKSASQVLASNGPKLAVRFGCVFAALMLPVMVSATPIVGNFGQAPQAGTNGIVAFAITPAGPNYIDFCPENNITPPAPGCTVVNNGLGNYNVSGGTGSFIGVSGSATIKDLTDTGVAPFTAIGAPGTPLSVDNFLVIAAHPLWNFRLTKFEAQSCITTPTQFCIGGFQFSQAGPNVSITVVFDGTIINNEDLSGSASAFTDVITAQYNNTTIAAVLAAAGSPGGIDSNAWSGSVAALPEPGTISLIGSSLIGLSLMLRRKVRKG